ncbi:MAG: Ni/Fe hydrogenase subunit alpha [Alphaproteobacteria bacterium]|nr:Ni/Fe hydrogenase subunit alpha [Alphaproteobacteria bacterium]
MATKVKPQAAKASKKNLTRVIEVDELSRVEGEGALYVRVQDGIVKECKFRIVEPPRFFEAFLQGRSYLEVPDITARICGICPMAYLMGSQHAMEDALSVKIPQDIHDLRRLMYCGEWIESHVLHAAMLHAPDFLGLDDVLQLAATNKDVVANALRMKKLGNDLLEVIGGGRAIHPVNTRVGGFYKLPEADDLRALIPELKWGIEASLAIGKLFATFHFPDFEYDYTCVSMAHPEVYAIMEGGIKTNRGQSFPVSDYHKVFKEVHIQHSSALTGRTVDGNQPYLTGPLARYNNNYDFLTDLSKKAAKAMGLDKTCYNPFKSILVRMVETVYCCEEAIRLIEAYKKPKAPFVPSSPAAATGYGASEAPRGVCYHSYKLDSDGRVLNAVISSPTAQNQPQIERDLEGVIARNLDKNDRDLTLLCEQAIRNYDPCISCSAHFLRLTMVRD